MGDHTTDPPSHVSKTCSALVLIVGTLHRQGNQAKPLRSRPHASFHIRCASCLVLLDLVYPSQAQSSRDGRGALHIVPSSLPSSDRKCIHCSYKRKAMRCPYIVELPPRQYNPVASVVDRPCYRASTSSLSSLMQGISGCPLVA